MMRKVLFLLLLLLVTTLALFPSKGKGQGDYCGKSLPDAGTSFLII